MGSFLEYVYLSACVCIGGIIPGLCKYVCCSSKKGIWDWLLCTIANVVYELEGASMLGCWVGVNPGHMCVFIFEV